MRKNNQKLKTRFRRYLLYHNYICGFILVVISLSPVIVILHVLRYIKDSTGYLFGGLLILFFICCDFIVRLLPCLLKLRCPFCGRKIIYSQIKFKKETKLLKKLTRKDFKFYCLKCDKDFSYSISTGILREQLVSNSKNSNKS